MDIRTDGFKELERALRVLPRNAEKRVLRSSAMAAIRKGRRAVKAAAPRSVEQSPNSQKYGRLSQNLKVKPLRKRATNTFTAKLDTGRAFWAVFYEKGTRRQPARPFFDPAFKRAENEMLDAATEKMIAGIERELNKLIR